MAVGINIASGDYPAFEAAAVVSSTGSILVALEPYVGDDLVTQIEALSTGAGSDYNKMIAEIVQALRVLQTT